MQEHGGGEGPPAAMPEKGETAVTVTLPTWAGGRAPLRLWRAVLAGWPRHWAEELLTTDCPVTHALCTQGCGEYCERAPDPCNLPELDQ